MMLHVNYSKGYNVMTDSAINDQPQGCRQRQDLYLKLGPKSPHQHNNAANNEDF